jgi:hypothetical protein
LWGKSVDRLKLAVTQAALELTRGADDFSLLALTIRFPRPDWWKSHL